MKALKYLFVCFLVLGFAATLSVPAIGYDIPEIPNDIAINRANPNAALMGKFGSPASLVCLTGTSNPDPLHIINGDTGAPAVSGDTKILVYPSIPLEEDAATEIGSLIDEVESYNLQRGIENSLDLKLSKALQSMNAVNSAQSDNAVNSLISFIKECQAQSGNKLEVIEASTLISAANAIIHLLVGTSIDSGNFQWAVDNVAAGGIVKAQTKDLDDEYRVLDFGGQTVTALTEVHIEGEKLPNAPLASSGDPATDWDEDGYYNDDFLLPDGVTKIKSDRAVIYNGVVKIGDSYITILPQDDPIIKNSKPQNASIKSLRLEKSPIGATPVYSVIDVEISDIIVTNVVVGILDVHWFYEVYGIPLIGAYGGLRGNVTVKNNYVDLFGDDPANDPIVDWSIDSRMWGIALIGIEPDPGVTGRIVKIADNTVKNCGITAIYIVNPIGAEKLTVSGNYIKQRNFPNFGDYAWGVGIDLINTNYLSVSVDGAIIQNNTMENVPGHGIFLLGFNLSDISGNDIAKILFTNDKAYKYSTFGVNLLSGISMSACFGNELYGNTILGKGAYAYNLSTWDGGNTITIGEVEPGVGELDGFDPASNDPDDEQMPENKDNPDEPNYWPHDSAHILLGGTTFFNTIKGTTGLAVLDPPDYSFICGDAGYGDFGEPLWFPDPLNCNLKLPKTNILIP